MERSRATVEPTFGGKACPHSAETRACNTHTCATPCIIGSWTAWSTCSTSCAAGFQSRTRTFIQPTNGGKKCPHSSETRGCNHGRRRLLRDRCRSQAWWLLRTRVQIMLSHRRWGRSERARAGDAVRWRGDAGCTAHFFDATRVKSILGMKTRALQELTFLQKTRVTRPRVHTPRDIHESSARTRPATLPNPAHLHVR